LGRALAWCGVLLAAPLVRPGSAIALELGGTAWFFDGSVHNRKLKEDFENAERVVYLASKIGELHGWAGTIRVE